MASVKKPFSDLTLVQRMAERAAADPDDKEARKFVLLFGLATRLRQVVAHYGESERQFSIDAGLSTSQVNHITTLGKGASFETLAAIVRTAKVDGHWLLTGEGEMLRRVDTEVATPKRAVSVVPPPATRQPEMESDGKRKRRRRA